MGVAKATLSGITKRIYILRKLCELAILTMMFFNVTDSVKCPKHCNCFPVLPNNMFDPFTYDRVLESTNNTLTAVSCQRRQLTYVPTGLSADTALLFLTYNGLTHLNRSMFAGLNMIQCLDVSHNKLIRIANDTFDDMTKLEYLDISYNLIQQLPRGFLCPWHQEGFMSTVNDIGCDNHPTARTVLRLSMGQNQWHCTCQLQEFIEHFSCAGVYTQSPCIEFYSNRNDAIGQCSSPQSLREVSITRLSSSKVGKGNINACKPRSRKVDIPLLVTMFTWMGVVFGYVIYFIWWNQREITNHRSYLATLHKRAQSNVPEPRSRVQERPLTTDSVFIRESRASGKPLPEHYEMKPLRKEKPSFVQKLQKGEQEQESTEVWVQRSDSDASVECDNYGTQQSYPRIIQVQPYQPREDTRSCSFETPPSRSKKTGSDVYCISSL